MYVCSTAIVSLHNNHNALSFSSIFYTPLCFKSINMSSPFFSSFLVLTWWESADNKWSKMSQYSDMQGTWNTVIIVHTKQQCKAMRTSQSLYSNYWTLHKSSHKQYVNKWVWLCSNKTLFTDTGIWISFIFTSQNTILLLTSLTIKKKWK